MSTTDGRPSVPLVMVANHSVNIILLLLKLKFVSMLPSSSQSIAN